MSVSYETMIDKMIAQLNLAKQSQNDHKFPQHIGNVHLLCEIILEEDRVPSPPEEDQISDQELTAMLGESQKKPSVSNYNINDDANGDSLFDF